MDKLDVYYTLINLIEFHKYEFMVILSVHIRSVLTEINPAIG